MPLTPTGVEFKSEGFNDFIKNMGEAAKTIVSFGRMTQNRLQALRELNTILETATKQFKSYAQAGGDAVKINDALADSFDAVSEGGNILANIINGLGGNIKKYASTGAKIGGILGTIAGFAFPSLGISNAVMGSLGAIQGAIIGSLVGAGQTVVKGFTNFFGNILKTITGLLPKVLRGIVNAGVQIGKAIFSLGKAVLTAAGKILSSVVNVIKGLLSSIFDLFSGRGIIRVGGWRSLGDSVLEAMFKFEILKQVIRKTIEVIKDFARNSVEAAEEIQFFTLRLDGLISRQIRNLGITNDYSKSVNIATDYTKELLDWMRKLSYISPVAIDDINQTVSLSIAMGWGVESAKELTAAMIDYTAATGLSSDVMERIIYNFAQMKGQGKVTGTELRDLGRGAFMPINTILRIMYDNLGDVTMSFDAFREAASEGALPVEDFFKAFIQYVNEDMPDAAKNLGDTIKAIKIRLQNLFDTFLGWDIITPVIKKAWEPVNEFLKKIDFDRLGDITKAIGQALVVVLQLGQVGFQQITSAAKRFFELLGLAPPSIETVIKSIIKLGLMIFKVEWYISELIRKLFPFARQIKEKFGDTFEEMGDDFFSWGLKLIYTFARGIVEGAAKFLTQAINFVAKLLTSWFKPGSPPKILPHIDLWGLQTANEWLKGFTKADFGLLDSIQDSVKSALGALTGLGIITDLQSNQDFVDISLLMIRTLDELNRTGQISTGIFERLAAIPGPFGDEIAKLLKVQLEYAQALKQQAVYEKMVEEATRRAEKAQLDYDAAVKRSARQAIHTNKLIKDYNNLLRRGASRQILKNQLKVVNASEVQLHAFRLAEQTKKDELEISKEQLKIAQDILETYKKSIEPLKDAVEMQEAIIKNLVELAQASSETTSALGSAAQEAAEGFDSMVESLGDLEGRVSSINFDDLKKQAEKEFKDLFDNILPAIWDDAWYNNFQSPNSGFQVAVSSMKTAFSGALTTMRGWWDEFAAAVHLPSWEEIAGAWNNAVAPIDDGKAGRGKDKREDKGGNVGLVDRFRNVLELFSEDIKKSGGVLAVLGNIGRYILSKIAEKISEAWNSDEVQGWLSTAKDNLFTALANAISGPQILPTGPSGTLGLENLLSPEQRISNSLLTACKELGKAIVGGVIEGALEKIKSYDWNINIWQLVLDTFLEFFSIANLVSGIMKPNGTAIISGLTGGMIHAIEIFDWVNEVWKLITDNFKKFFGIKSPSTLFKTYGVDIINGLKDGFTQTLSNLLGPEGAITQAVNSFIDGVKTLFGIGGTTAENNPFINLGQSIINGITNGIRNFKSKILTEIQTLGIDIPLWLRRLLESSSPSKVFMRIGRDTMLGFAMGISNSKDIIHRAIKSTVSPNIANAGATRMSAQTMNATPVSRTTTLNFGDVYLGDNMDFAMFKARVNQVLTGG